ncbi:ASCH domain-containing protein [Fructobacillus americanaquae]|uniref:ASCH domain-containing protein n=1 Tax=Fructobacillus americanaquae TaxID=2940302 RepID=A0ABY5C2R6_9LACO|nr:ASCH domain-containing protein [Fructobacillus americanaquae]USS92400.1 ASCH domain-containing protein [Fructobacillus americanaquae]
MTPAAFFQQAKDEGVIPLGARLQSSFQFGAAADALAQLVLKGVKTATASAYDLYEEEPLPAFGAYDVILDGQNQPVGIIKNDAVTIEQYLDVNAQHAYQEGEGDRSLAYWRQVHHDFFTAAYQEEGKVFRENQSPIVLEKFHLVYPQ